jgi:formylglycine-generating enzyme required for sulfatase activity
MTLILHCLILTLLLLLPFAGGAVHAQSLGSDQEKREPSIGSSALPPPFRDCDDCPEMVVIPGGSFMMGSPGSEEGRLRNEGPQHRVSVSTFALGQYEVTRGEFARFVAETGHTTGACVYWDVGFGDAWRTYDMNLHNPSHGHRQTAKHPVTCVSWHDAKAYVAWLKEQTGKAYRLPSESEWEYAARGGTRSRYFWGDDSGSACRYANGHDETSQQSNPFNWVALPCSDGHALTSPVGSLEANGFLLFDMVGNLAEWVEDHYRGTYDGAPENGAPWRSTEPPTHVLRGGSWESAPRDLRSASRIWSRPASRLNSNGFRVALSLSETAD